MFKYWAKNKFFSGLLCTVAFAALFSFAFAMSPSKNLENVSNENLIYLNSEIDYQIPSPSKEQLNEINGKDFVNKTFGYYLTKASVEGNKTSKVSFLLSNDLDNLSITMFNDKNLVEKVEDNSNPIYLDEIAKKALDVKAGDSVKVSFANSSFTYTVTSIYKENSLFKDGTAIVKFEGAIKYTYCANAKEYSLSGAFIDSSNDAKCDEFLQSYKPLGRVRERSEFETDEACEAYNNTILNGNYSNEITNFSAKRELANKDVDNTKSKLTTMCIIGSVVVGMGYFFASQFFRNRKSEKKYFGQILNDKNKTIFYRLYSLIADSLIYVGLTVVLGIILNFTSMLLISILITFGFILITFVINLMQDKKYVR